MNQKISKITVNTVFCFRNYSYLSLYLLLKLRAKSITDKRGATSGNKYKEIINKEEERKKINYMKKNSTFV